MNELKLTQRSWRQACATDTVGQGVVGVEAYARFLTFCDLLALWAPCTGCGGMVGQQGQRSGLRCGCREGKREPRGEPTYTCAYTLASNQHRPLQCNSCCHTSTSQCHITSFWGILTWGWSEKRVLSNSTPKLTIKHYSSSCSKWPHTWQLKTTEMYSLANLEARLGLNQGVSRAVLLSEALGESISVLPQLPVAASIPWPVATSHCTVILCLFFWITYKNLNSSNTWACLSLPWWLVHSRHEINVGEFFPGHRLYLFLTRYTG